MVSEKSEKIEKTSKNQQKVIQDFDDSDEIKFTKNQNIELDLIRDLQSGSIITSPLKL
ncbi:12944_t:CDS:1, partial [Funneliformis geosporum]